MFLYDNHIAILLLCFFTKIKRFPLNFTPHEASLAHSPLGVAPVWSCAIDLAIPGTQCFASPNIRGSPRPVPRISAVPRALCLASTWFPVSYASRCAAPPSHMPLISDVHRAQCLSFSLFPGHHASHFLCSPRPMPLIYVVPVPYASHFRCSPCRIPHFRCSPCPMHRISFDSLSPYLSFPFFPAFHASPFRCST